MGKHLNKAGMLACLAIAAAAVLGLCGNAFTLLAFVNKLFLCSLVLLIAGGSLFVLQGGVLNGMLYSFKRFFNRTTKVGEYTKRFDSSKELVDPFHFSLTVPLLLSGGVLFALTLLGSIRL